MAISNSAYIFDYLNDVWQLLPDQDQSFFAELWGAYQRTYGYLWQQQFESDLANTITNLPLYNTKRWLRHSFSEETQVAKTATYESPVDFTFGINLADRYLVKLALNEDPPVEVDIRGVNPYVTTVYEICAKINTALGATVVSPKSSGGVLLLTSNVTGYAGSFTFYTPSIGSKDATEIVFGIPTSATLPLTFPPYRYVYQLGETNIVRIPVLQNTIHDDLATVVLAEGVDYTIEFGTGVISFANQPPATLWAKDTICNFETPYNNFGYLMGIYDSNTEAYLKSIQGLWHAFWTGPRPSALKSSLYLLFGLPTASYDGSVVQVTPTEITLYYPSVNKTEVFSIPENLLAIVSAGDDVVRYDPLVNGIELFDKVNFPGFLANLGGRFSVQPFLTQFASRGPGDSDESRALTLLEESTYLPQITIDAFFNPAIKLGNVPLFLRSIQPKARTFLNQILVGSFKDPLPLLDEGATWTKTALWPSGVPALGLDINFDSTDNVDWSNNTMASDEDLMQAELEPGYIALDAPLLFFGDFGKLEVYQSAVLIGTYYI